MEYKKLTVKELIAKLQEMIDNDDVLVATEVGQIATKEVVNVIVEDGEVVLECRDC